MTTLHEFIFYYGYHFNVCHFGIIAVRNMSLYYVHHLNMAININWNLLRLKKKF